jgi:hypothetical protein
MPLGPSRTGRATCGSAVASYADIAAGAAEALCPHTVGKVVPTVRSPRSMCTHSGSMHRRPDCTNSCASSHTAALGSAFASPARYSLAHVGADEAASKRAAASGIMILDIVLLLERRCCCVGKGFASNAQLVTASSVFRVDQGYPMHRGEPLSSRSGIPTQVMLRFRGRRCTSPDLKFLQRRTKRGTSEATLPRSVPELWNKST